MTVCILEIKVRIEGRIGKTPNPVRLKEHQTDSNFVAYFLTDKFSSSASKDGEHPLNYLTEAGNYSEWVVFLTTKCEIYYYLVLRI